VFYRACDAKRPYIPMDRSCGYNAFKFHVDAAEPGKYTTFVVRDMLERGYIIEGQYSETPVFADDLKGNGSGIAVDLVNEWARNTIGPGGNALPGIFVCAGDEPTPEELRLAIDGQMRLCEWIIVEAENNWRNDKRNLVKESDREAARWYLAQCDIDGTPIPVAYRNIEWMSSTPGDKVERADCPWCMEKYRKGAFQCPTCKGIVDMGKYHQFLQHQQQAQELEAQYAAQAQTAPDMPGEPVNPSLPATA
jgi:hypothetical protein